MASVHCVQTVHIRSIYFWSSLPIDWNDENWLIYIVVDFAFNLKFYKIFRLKDDDDDDDVGNCWKSSFFPPPLSLGCYPVLPVVSRWWISCHSALVQSICLFIIIIFFKKEISLGRMHTRIDMIIIIHIVDV